MKNVKENVKENDEEYKKIFLESKDLDNQFNESIKEEGLLFEKYITPVLLKRSLINRKRTKINNILHSWEKEHHTDKCFESRDTMCHKCQNEMITKWFE